MVPFPIGIPISLIACSLRSNITPMAVSRLSGRLAIAPTRRAHGVQGAQQARICLVEGVGRDPLRGARRIEFGLRALDDRQDAGRIKRDWLARIGIPLRDASIGNKGSLVEDFGEAKCASSSTGQGRRSSTFALFNNQIDRSSRVVSTTKRPASWARRLTRLAWAFRTPDSLPWSVKSLRSALSKRQRRVSVIRLACALLD